jgi:peptidoglycan/LPS O-acetylase OafA/YrhL
MSNSFHLKYRSDIDGLRALAVMAVVIYHAFPSWLPGGFVGVDIFFVISGYLISKIILTNIGQNTFYIFDFYNRRIKRIFPALIIVMTATLLGGWFLLFYSEYELLGKHIASGTVFVSNFFFYTESGYFDISAELKPAIHLWSLSVEEQFYIFWPLLLIFIFKKNWNFLKIALTLILISFLINFYLIKEKPMAAFYLTVPRFWELVVGGVLAYLVSKNIFFNERNKNIYSILGFLLILFSFFLIHKNAAFPGWIVLMPVLGTFFFIAAGASAFINKKIFSNKILIWIGLISYPLYLWHWPLLSYLKIIKGNEPAIEYKITAILFSILFSWLTYFFVEKKIRKKNNFKIAKTLLSLAALIFFFSLLITLSRGAPNRQINQELDFTQDLKIISGSRQSNKSCKNLNNLDLVTKREVCLSNSKSPNILFAGDSKAMAIHSAIYSKKIIVNSMLISGHACELYPNLNYEKKALYKNCNKISNKVLDVVNNIKSINTIILATKFYSSSDKNSSYYLDGIKINNEDAFLIGSGYLIKKLLDKEKKVIFFIDAPELNNNPINCIQRVSFIAESKKCGPSLEELNKIRADYIKGIKKLSLEYPQLKIFDPTNVLCKNSKCEVKENSNYLYNDQSHISIYASTKLLKKMKLDGLIDY